MQIILMRFWLENGANVKVLQNEMAHLFRGGANVFMIWVNYK